MRAMPVLLLACVVLVACNGNGGEVENPYLEPDPVDYPDTHLAIVQAAGERGVAQPMALVNRTHGKYLEREKDRPVPTYTHPYLTRRPDTSFSILTNEMMQELVEGTMKESGFFAVAQPFQLAEMGKTGWPAREAIVFEQGGQAWVLYNPKELDRAGKPLPLATENVQAQANFSQLKIIVIEVIQNQPAVERAFTTDKDRVRTMHTLENE
ncbi:MAG: hypothetical protein HY720_14655 [Planctomycetes bacterium]|nr:hypothetical protein [Planctomycetota bacterium]